MSTGTTMRELWNNYHEEALFLVVLSAVTAFGHWLSWFVPVDLFEKTILPMEHGALMAVCFVGAWLLFRHSDGLRIRRACGYALVAWGIAEVYIICQNYIWQQPVLILGDEALSAYVLFVGNMLGWLLLIYPTETLRPGWLNTRRALLQLLPLAALCVLDYLVPLDLRWLISLYPVLLFIIAITHIRAYRVWCENNYSSMEHIDVQWIVRYFSMLLVLGASFGYMMISDNPCRTFAQNLLLLYIFVYSTGEVLFRKDPWEGVTSEGEGLSAENSERSEGAGSMTGEAGQREAIRLFEQWVEREKPYLNPNFRLTDAREALHVNRTYLSQAINSIYGCSFYRMVNRKRVEEAKRLMCERPELKQAEIAALSGFSSPALFSRIFTREEGVNPKEWIKKIDSASKNAPKN